MREESSHPTPPSHLVAAGLLPPKGSTLTDLQEDRLTASLTSEQLQKLFWLGFIEAAPLFAGGGYSIHTGSKLHAIIGVLVGIALTSIICWCLRHQTPLTRIEFTNKTTVVLKIPPVDSPQSAVKVAIASKGKR